MKRPTAGGGFPAIWYTLRKSHQAGGLLRMWKALRSKNACKTCALGMGGQKGGMVNEAGHFPEVCKKSIQAMAADMQGAIQPDFFTKFDFKKLRSFSPREMETAGRITLPYYAGPDDKSYRPITWEDAITRVATKLKNTAPDDTFWYFSGRSSNEAGFLLQLFARLYGTNNVNNCSFYCHQASGVGLTSVTGSSTGTVTLEDAEHADLIFVIGANPASNHPRFMRTLLNMKRGGGKVVVVNPLKELGLVRFKVPSDVRSLLFGTTIADHYIQPHIGGDIAFLSGVAKVLLEKNQIDRAFLEAHTENWPALETHFKALAWDDILARSGVEKAEIEAVAALYATAKKAIFCWAMGVTHHEFGVQTVQTIGALAAMRGMLGRPQAGLLPLRGHSNVQGLGTVGVTPKLKDEVFARLQERFGVRL
ncbi:MAG TPA: molybdopterin-dependent oxidoreductase, partial [Planctomycetota bacterium]|nr:molybdopterin-dependent oxidoreductase [Planctomycetota bacterium]